MGALFDAVRQRISAEDAARFYGLNVNGRHKALCPWHDDRHPSLSFNPRNGRCYCFACNNGGDAVDVATVLLNISPLEAAQRLNSDFGLGLDDEPRKPCSIGESPVQAARREREALKAEFNAACNTIHATHAILDHITPETMTDPAFTESLENLSRAQDLADAILATLNQ